MFDRHFYDLKTASFYDQRQLVLYDGLDHQNGHVKLLTDAMQYASSF